MRLKLPIGCLELPAHVTLADLTLTNRPGIAATNFLKNLLRLRHYFVPLSTFEGFFPRYDFTSFLQGPR